MISQLHMKCHSTFFFWSNGTHWAAFVFCSHTFIVLCVSFFSVFSTWSYSILFFLWRLDFLGYLFCSVFMLCYTNFFHFLFIQQLDFAASFGEIWFSQHLMSTEMEFFCGCRYMSRAFNTQSNDSFMKTFSNIYWILIEVLNHFWMTCWISFFFIAWFYWLTNKQINFHIQTMFIIRCCITLSSHIFWVWLTIVWTLMPLFLLVLSNLKFLSLK